MFCQLEVSHQPGSEPGDGAKCVHTCKAIVFNAIQPNSVMPITATYSPMTMETVRSAHLAVSNSLEEQAGKESGRHSAPGKTLVTSSVVIKNYANSEM